MKNVVFLLALTVFSCLCKQPQLFSECFIVDKEISRILQIPNAKEKYIIIEKINEHIFLLNKTIQDLKDNIEEADTLAIEMYIHGMPKFLTYRPNVEDIKKLWKWDQSDMELFDFKLTESRFLWNEFIRTYRMLKKLDKL